MHEHSVNLSIPNMSSLFCRLICRPSFSESDVRGVFLLALFHSPGQFFRLISRPLGRAGGAAAEVVGAEPLGIHSILTPIQAHFDALCSIPQCSNAGNLLIYFFLSATAVQVHYLRAPTPQIWFSRL